MPARIPVFRRFRRVEERDTDVLGHVNNAVWVGWIVDLAEAHSEALGLGYRATRALGGVWVVRRHDVRYDGPALPGEEIEETTWVSRMRGARSIRHSRFRGAGRTRVVASTEWAFVSPSGLRPVRLPEALRERFDLVPPEGPGSDG